MVTIIVALLAAVAPRDHARLPAGTLQKFGRVAQKIAAQQTSQMHGEILAAALSAAGPAANSHRVCPRFLPLFGQLRPKLHRVHRGSCESVCVRPSAGRHAGQGF
jgi:hypothetical protein